MNNPLPLDSVAGLRVLLYVGGLVEHERGEAVVQDIREVLHRARVLGLNHTELQLALTSSN